MCFAKKKKLDRKRLRPPIANSPSGGQRKDRLMKAYVREAYRAHLEALGFVAHGSDRLDDRYCIMTHTASAVAFVIGPEGVSQVPVERETD